MSKAQAVGAVGEDVHRMGHVVGGQRRSKAIGVFRRNIRILRRVPEEERRSRRSDQRIERDRTTQLRRCVLTQQNELRRTVRLGLHRRDRIAENSELNRCPLIDVRSEGRQAREVPTGREAHDPDRVGTLVPQAPDLGLKCRERRGMPRVERIPEHARLQAQPAQPIDDRLGLVSGMHLITAPWQHDHMRRHLIVLFRRPSEPLGHTSHGPSRCGGQLTVGAATTGGVDDGRQGGRRHRCRVRRAGTPADRPPGWRCPGRDGGDHPQSSALGSQRAAVGAGRGSFGRPSTSSPTMPRWIWEEPA